MGLAQHIPLMRIMLRYGTAALVTHGVVSADTGALLSSPEMLTALVGASGALATEFWYRRDKKRGGPTWDKTRQQGHNHARYTPAPELT